MAPKKKKTPKNAFYFYMLDFQRNRPQSNFPCGLKDVAEAAGASWKSLSAEQKRPFEEMATREKGRCGNHDKYTTQGQSYAELEMQQKEAADKIALMKKTIMDTLISLGRNTGLATAPWFLVHINYFVMRDDGNYYPAEFAIAKYSIKEGIHTKIFSCFVDPGDLPTGYSYKAKLHCDDTHKCPLPPAVLDGAKQGLEVLANMDAFVKEHIGATDEPMPPFYTLKSCTASVSNILSQWALEKGRRANYYRVFPLEQFFYDIKMFGLKPEGERLVIGGVEDNGFSHISIAENLLINDSYSFTLHISCPFHEEEDVMNYCSQSYVRRWGWIMSNHLCRNLDVQMRPGAHCPRDVVPESLVMTTQRARYNADAAAAPPEETVRTRAAGRGMPLARSSESAAAPPARASSNAPAPVAWPNGARPKVKSPTPRYDQFEDAAPTRKSRIAGDGGPLRQPKSTSVAHELSRVDANVPLIAEDFPALGRLTISSSMGRGSRLPPQRRADDESDSDDSDDPPGVGRGWNTVTGRGGKRGGF